MDGWIAVLNSSIIVGGDSGVEVVTDNQTNTQAAVSTPAVGNEAAPVNVFAGPSGIFTILMYAMLPVALYFIMIRPQRKREKEMRAMRESVGVGDNVLTSSGLYGVVTAVGEDCFVIEFGTNKGVRIPVRKLDVLGIKTPKIHPSSGNKEITET